jgi:hypothetical protein
VALPEDPLRWLANRHARYGLTVTLWQSSHTQRHPAAPKLAPPLCRCSSRSVALLVFSSLSRGACVTTDARSSRNAAACDFAPDVAPMESPQTTAPAAADRAAALRRRRALERATFASAVARFQRREGEPGDRDVAPGGDEAAPPAPPLQQRRPSCASRGVAGALACLLRRAAPWTCLSRVLRYTPTRVLSDVADAGAIAAACAMLAAVTLLAPGGAASRFVARDCVLLSAACTLLRMEVARRRRHSAAAPHGGGGGVDADRNGSDADVDGADANDGSGSGADSGTHPALGAATAASAPSASAAAACALREAALRPITALTEVLALPLAYSGGAAASPGVVLAGAAAVAAWHWARLLGPTGAHGSGGGGGGRVVDAHAAVGSPAAATIFGEAVHAHAVATLALLAAKPHLPHGVATAAASGCALLLVAPLAWRGAHALRAWKHATTTASLDDVTAVMLAWLPVAALLAARALDIAAHCGGGGGGGGSSNGSPPGAAATDDGGCWMSNGSFAALVAAVLVAGAVGRGAHAVITRTARCDWAAFCRLLARHPQGVADAGSDAFHLEVGALLHGHGRSAVAAAGIAASPLLSAAYAASYLPGGGVDAAPAPSTPAAAAAAACQSSPPPLDLARPATAVPCVKAAAAGTASLALLAAASAVGVCAAGWRPAPALLPALGALPVLAAVNTLVSVANLAVVTLAVVGVAAAHRGPVIGGGLHVTQVTPCVTCIYGTCSEEAVRGSVATAGGIDVQQ